VIRVQNYTKTYRETLAVHDLSFELSPGNILGMVGQNGAGKTTTLRAIAGIIPPTDGSLSVAGFDVASQPRKAKKRLAYIPDEPRLFDALTVWEHLQFNAAAYQVENWESKALALLEKFELLEKRNSTARELSRGMRQKVAICSGFLFDPAAILFDEPHTGLDPQGIRTMKNSIEQRASSGAAVIVSSHLLSLIEDLCTHLLILAKGRALFFGTLAQLREQYPDLGGDDSLEQVFFRATDTMDSSEAATNHDGADKNSPKLIGESGNFKLETKPESDGNSKDGQADDTSQNEAAS